MKSNLMAKKESCLSIDPSMLALLPIKADT